ncbi:MAG: hypothetical protein NTW31_04560, partial [Bacteroidetes bacterium]|nr:hypothetical protein [Bacteroidota bacterium]
MDRSFRVPQDINHVVAELDNINETVNLEAISKLHRIAKHSEDVRQTVFDNLCSFVRKVTAA